MNGLCIGGTCRFQCNGENILPVNAPESELEGSTCCVGFLRSFQNSLFSVTIELVLYMENWVEIVLSFPAADRISADYL